MITELARSRNAIFAINQNMGKINFELYSINNIDKPIYSKQLMASEYDYAFALVGKVKKAFNQTNGKRRNKY